MTLIKTTQRLAQQLFGVIAFYTTIPISARWTLDFTRIARWSPVVGLLIGLILAGSDFMLRPYLPLSLRSAIVVMMWIFGTGALHLDGAMDTADGLGVWDTERRLAVMADSRSGAFGVIAAIAIIILKVVCIDALPSHRSMALIWLPVWGRWAHVLAIGQYPYLKLHGKARRHHDDFRMPWDYFPGLILQVLIICRLYFQDISSWQELLGIVGAAGIVSWSTGYWFYRQFKGMTGDIHGAIVEWTETFVLVCWVGLLSGK
ncbi:MAG: adenosylcobinamide-GDP ribazoletransferase [Cyanobacteria bacterium P01_F01_bin.42]